MGQDGDIVHFQEGVVRVDRLLFEDVQAGACDLTALEGLNQGRFIDYRAPGGVDQEGGGFFIRGTGRRS